jgi:hypothetical protein
MNCALQDKRIIGLQPWLPGFLGRSAWWNEPIRAERLAAVRIGIAVVLLADVLWLYLPQAADFYGGGSLGSPEVFAGRLARGLRWSLLAGVSDQSLIFAAMSAWIAAAVCLLLGIYPRVAAGVAWALAISFHNANPYLHNSGDMVRQILLFYLMVSPCGAAWSIKSWRERRGSGDWRPAFIYPWPIRLLLIQMMAIYFVNGAYKYMGADWRDGEIMHRVLANLFWTRFSYEQLPLFPGAIHLMTWTTLVWELGFPLLVMIPKLRAPTLWIGAAFHVGTGILLTLGGFPFYMLCLYLPFVPWERWFDRVAGTASFVPRHGRIDFQTPGVNAAG